MAVSTGLKRRLALITGLRGLLMLLFGVFAVIWPTEALMVLVVAGALVLLAAGVLGLWGLTFGGAKSANFWFDVVRNALAILVGVLILISPLFSTVLTVTFLSVLIGIEALIFGAMEIFLVLRERESYARVWPMVVQGIFYILFGLVLVIFPVFSAMIGAIWIGIIAVLFGIGLMTAAWRMYRTA